MKGRAHRGGYNQLSILAQLPQSCCLQQLGPGSVGRPSEAADMQAPPSIAGDTHTHNKQLLPGQGASRDKKRHERQRENISRLESLLGRPLTRPATQTVSHAAQLHEHAGQLHRGPKSEMDQVDLVRELIVGSGRSIRNARENDPPYHLTDHTLPADRSKNDLPSYGYRLVNGPLRHSASLPGSISSVEDLI